MDFNSKYQNNRLLSCFFHPRISLASADSIAQIFASLLHLRNHFFREAAQSLRVDLHIFRYAVVQSLCRDFQDAILVDSKLDLDLLRALLAGWDTINDVVTKVVVLAGLSSFSLSKSHEDLFLVVL